MLPHPVFDCVSETAKRNLCFARGGTLHGSILHLHMTERFLDILAGSLFSIPLE